MQVSKLSADAAQAAVWRDVRRELREAPISEQATRLAVLANSARRQIVDMISGAGQGHIGGDFSVIDLMTTLFYSVLDIDPTNPAGNDRDRFVLSKGHCAGALYSTLANCGFFSPSELSTFMAPYSALNGHPNRNKIPGVETNTGPLGHGLPVAVGTAIAAKLQGRAHRTVVVTGDGELQEGSNWEAFMSAAHFKLNNLVAIVDRNRLQQGARTEETNALDPLDQKLAAFGFEVREIDGHDFVALLDALRPASDTRPVAVIANTIKGKGVSFIEDRAEWHHKVPSSEQVILAHAELEAQKAEAIR